MAETQQEKLMRLLGVDAETANQIIADDKAIDRGEKMSFDLTPEQEKETRKYRQADREVSTKKVSRERKPNELKAQIIAEISTFLTENTGFCPENVEITNKERQISFKVGGETFELTLVQKRKPKN